MRSTLLVSLIGFLAVCLPLASSAGGERRSHPKRLIVKFHADGEHALSECAVRLERSGRTFASATRDQSPALDALRARFGVRHTRALFRENDDRSFDEQRRALRAALRRKASGRSRRGHGRERPLPELAHVYSVAIAETASLADAVSAFEADPHVAWAQPDHLNELNGSRFDDPFLTSVGSWGQGFADLWGLLRIRSDQAWSQSEGEGVVVAVVDTGLDYLHPDIADNVFVHPGEDLNGNGVADPWEWNGLDDDGNGFVDDFHGFDFVNSLDANEDGDYLDPDDISDSDPWDDHGHGTHVSGTIAAVGGNGIGIVGVAPRARIMALKGFPAQGPGLDSVLWRAVLYAVQNGARVINTSWSCRGRCPINPLAEEMVATVHALGGVLVTSAGNSQDDVAFKSPENLYETITVGSSDVADDFSTQFSNFGLNVDVVAPGGAPVPFGGPRIVSPHKNILSLRAIDSTASPALAVAGDYIRNAGTSMSAPHVSGVVALLLGVDPNLDYAEIKTSLKLGAVDLGEPGHDASFGAGRLDAPDALDALRHADAELVFDSPSPLATLDPLEGPHPIHARAAGSAIEDVTVSYGSGLTPTSWTSLHAEAPESGDEPGRLRLFWRTSELEDGAYTLRLQANTSAGRTISEFLSVSLERHHPLQIAAHPGTRPRVSRGRVVYEAIDPESGEIDLRLSDLRSAIDAPLVDEPGDQRDADFEGRVLTWLDGPKRDYRAPLRACRLSGRGLECDPFTVSGASRPRERAVVSRGRLYWGELADGDTDLFTCAVEAAGCEVRPFQSGPDSQRSPGAAGRIVAWLSRASGRLAIDYCELDERTGECPRRPVVPERLVTSSPVVGDGFLAWEQEGIPDGSVWLCPFDPESGLCEARLVAERASVARPRVSGRRLVFSADTPQGNREIWLCEWDPLLDDCLLQRLTGHAGRQSQPDIDGNLVVWEDDRIGETHIFGLRLPTLRHFGSHKTRVGRPLSILLLGRHQAGSRPILEGRLADGRPLSAVGARLIEGREGRAELRWRPSRRHVGTHRFTLSARTETGLTTQETIEVTVERAARMSGRSWLWQLWLAWWRGGALTQ